MSSPVVVVLVLVVVGAIAWLMRRRDPESASDPAAPAAPDAERAAEAPSYAEVVEDDAEDDDDDPEHIAVTSDGLAFFPQAHAVRIAPERSFRSGRAQGGGDGETARIAFGEEEDGRAPQFLSAGDLVAARVIRGAPELDPWRLETLGRDRDMQIWSFETPEAAEAARAMLARRVVRAPLDEFGEPIVFGAADFEAAERELERTLHELTTMTDDEATGEPDR